MQDISREIPAYADPIYMPPPKPTEIPLQEIPRKLTDLDTDINMHFKENSPYQEGVISECIKGLTGHISKNHQN